MAGRDFKKCDNFCYLGVNVNERNGMQEEVTARLKSANRAFYGAMHLFKSRKISQKTKLRIYNVIIRPVLTYGCETWTHRKKDKDRLSVFENKRS